MSMGDGGNCRVVVRWWHWDNADAEKNADNLSKYAENILYIYQIGKRFYGKIHL